MASQYVRLLDPQVVGPSLIQPRENWLDLGAYRQIVVSFRVLKAGTGDNAAAVIKLQHAAVMEDEAFADTAASVRVDSTAAAIPTTIEVTIFTRYIRWVTGSAVAGSPVVLVDIVAKE